MVFYFGKCRVIIEFSFVLMVSFSMLTGTQTVLRILLFASLHECGHIVLLLLFGCTPDRLTLAFYGIGMAHSGTLNRCQECLFLLGGIAVNGLMALLGIDTEINLSLLLINALPLYPLDMGRVLALVLPYRVCRVITVCFLILLLIGAAVLKNISLLFIAIYITVFSLKEDLR